MYNDVPTTCFGRFLTGHHQVGIKCQRNYIPTINIDISIRVSTEKEGGGKRSRLQIQGTQQHTCGDHLAQLGMTTRPQQQTIVTPGHPRTPMPQGPAPVSLHTYLIIEHTMPTRLIHVFPTPVLPHTLYL